MRASRALLSKAPRAPPSAPAGAGRAALWLAGAGGAAAAWLCVSPSSRARVRGSGAYAWAARWLAMPLLRQLDAEDAHAAGVWAAGAGLAPLAAPAEAAELAGSLAGLRFGNPVCLAAGFDKQGSAVAGLFEAGFGGVEVGSVTPLPQPGSARPRMFRLAEDGAVINRFGFNSDGAVAVAERLAALRGGALRADGAPLLGVNLGKNKDGDAVADYVAGMRLLAPFADYVVVNVSSPNTAGLRALQHGNELRALLRAVRDARDDVFAGARVAAGAGDVTVPHGAGALALSPAASAAYRGALAARAAARAPPPPLLVKIAPDLTDGELRDIVAAARAARVDGLVVSNTTVARPPGLRSRHAAEVGGLSGAPLRAPATAALRKAYEAAAGALPLVGVGGVASADDAYEKIRNGASLVQLYSALAYHGPTLVADIKAGLAQRLRDDGFACVEDAVGVDTDVHRGRKKTGGRAAA
jgi:dihydroorotate dehydrogenase